MLNAVLCKLSFLCFSFVTESALNIAFGSLYCGEVNIPTGEVVAVLSAASLFQLDGMVDLCVS